MTPADELAARLPVAQVGTPEARALVAALAGLGRGYSVPCSEAPEDWYRVLDHLQRRAAVRCTPCPVLSECARYALASGERHGTWGGLTEAERLAIRRRDRRRRNLAEAAGSLPTPWPVVV